MNLLKNNFFNKTTLLVVIAIFVIVLSSLVVSYAFFNYTRTGPNNVIQTGDVLIQYTDIDTINLGVDFPLLSSDISSTHESNFKVSAKTSLSSGVDYNIYLIYGDTISNKERLLDSVISVKLEELNSPTGFTTTVNNFTTPTSPTFVNGKALLLTGHAENLSSLTDKNYKLTLWIDQSKIFVSSTVKRQTNDEGNPSLAVSTSGNVSNVGRYITNSSTLSYVTLYPATGDQIGKTIYTTNEFAKSYYSAKIVVEAVR